MLCYLVQVYRHLWVCCYLCVQGRWYSAVIEGANYTRLQVLQRTGWQFTQHSYKNLKSPINHNHWKSLNILSAICKLQYHNISCLSFVTEHKNNLFQLWHTVAQVSYSCHNIHCLQWCGYCHKKGYISWVKPLNGQTHIWKHWMSGVTFCVTSIWFVFMCLVQWRQWVWFQDYMCWGFIGQNKVELLLIYCSCVITCHLSSFLSVNWRVILFLILHVLNHICS
jgi:hypothetical protein